MQEHYALVGMTWWHEGKHDLFQLILLLESDFKKLSYMKIESLVNTYMYIYTCDKYDKD